jgi:hypothetical protein
MKQALRVCAAPASLGAAISRSVLTPVIVLSGWTPFIMSYSLSAAMRLRRIKMVYIARKNGGAVHHTSLEAMKQIDGIDEPEMETSDAEFEAAGCLVRVTGGKPVLGKTETGRDAETAKRRKTEIDAELREIDAKSGRAARTVALAVSAGQTPAKADAERLAALEAEADALRAELRNL